MNPYDNNPFKTDTKRIKNERDANRELAKTVADDVINTIKTIGARSTLKDLWDAEK